MEITHRPHVRGENVGEGSGRSSANRSIEVEAEGLNKTVDETTACKRLDE